MSRKSVGDGELYGLRHVTLLKKRAGKLSSLALREETISSYALNDLVIEYLALIW